MHKRGFNNTWVNNQIEITLTEDNHYRFRKWQEEAFHKLYDKQYRIINAPTGSGKSFLICGTIFNDLKRNPLMKAIIAVPQKVIASGFRKEYIQFPDGSKEFFSVSNDLLLDSSDECISKLNAFLDRSIPPFLYNERILLCSHATLNRAFESKEIAKDKLHDLSICIDEAHHIRLDDDEVLVDNSNKLGSIINVCISNNTNILTLTTATFFRGDEGDIIPSTLQDTFVRYDLPYDKYLPMMEHLKSFSYDFLLYKDNPVSILKDLYERDYKEGKFSKSIVYIPSVNSSDSWGDKEKEVEDIKGVFGDKWSIDENGVESTMFKGKKITLVDLVDDGALRKSRLKFIMDHAKSSEGPDLIIALGMFKEGANYEALDHEVIIGIRKSLTEVIQIIGRLLRDCEGKEHVSIYQCIPITFDDKDPEHPKDSLNNYLKAIYASLILEAVMTPRMKFKKGEGNGDVDIDPDDIEDFDDEEDDYIPPEVIGEIIEEVVELQSIKGTNHIDYDNEFVPLAERILSENNINVTDRNIKHIWYQLCKRTNSVKNLGINMEDIPFDAIKGMNPTGWIEGYFSGVVGGNVLEEFRRIVNALRVEAIENFNALIDWCEENGKTPSQKSKNEEEKILGRKLSQLKLSRKGGSTRHKWYSEYDKIIKERNADELFEEQDLKIKAIIQFNDLIDWWEQNGRTPSQKSKNEEEKILGSRLSRLKRSKNKLNDSKWYKEFDEIIKKRNAEELFKKINLKERSIKQFNELIIWWKENGRTPSDKTKDPIELYFGRLLYTHKKSKNNIGSGKWYKEFDEIIKKRNAEELFKKINLKERSIKQFNELIIWWKEYGKTPSPTSKDPIEKKLGQMFYKFRIAKNNKGGRTWYKEFDKIIKECNAEELFN